MKIVMTIREIMDKGLWEDFCEIRGWSVWIVSEGQADSSEEITLTEDEIKKLGIN